MSILLRNLSLLVGITLAVPAFGNCLTANETKQGVLMTREAPFYSVFYKPNGPGLTEQRLWSATVRCSQSRLYICTPCSSKRE